MEALMKPIMAIAAFAVISTAAAHAQAFDFEKKLKYDYACVVNAFSSEGDVYLSCKDQKGIIKTTVDIPMVSSIISHQLDIKKQMQMAKKVAKAKMVWGILEFSFSTQLYVLLTFNDDKTLIQNAVAYIQPNFDERIGRKGKIEL